MELVMDLFSKAVQTALNKLNGLNAYWSKDPMALTAYGLTQARQRWMGTSGKNATFPVKAMVNNIFTVLSSLAHNIELLKYHGIGPFYHGMVNLRNGETGTKAGKYAKEILENENFTKMMTRLQLWINNPTFIGHPKLDYLQGVVLDHFVAAGEGRTGSDHPPSATRIMIFAHFRDSAEEIVRVLKRNEPMIRPHVFVGQATSKGSEGMDQKRQLEVIQDFKTGKYNTLVATSIGEEGLDIGEVDLIVCYDSSASPIRMLQRMGRTGRKRAGNIVLLLMKGKEENSFVQAKDNYEKMQLMIAAGTRFNFHDEESPRIVPKEIQPAVDKRVVEIPIENTQVGLPEPKKGRGKAPKRPPKKFHMPDGVRTGFVKASRLGSEDDGEEDDAAPARKPRQTKLKVQELAPIPTLDKVLLTQVQQKELSRKFRDKVVDEYNDAPVTLPRLDQHPAHQRRATKIAAVGHGQASLGLVNVLNRMHNTTNARASILDSLSKRQDLDELCGGHERIVIGAEDGKSNRPTSKAAGKATKKAPVKPRKKSAASVVQVDSNDDLPGTPVTAAKKPRAPRKPAAPKAKPPPTITHINSEDDIDLPAPPPQKKPRGRPKKATTQPRTTSNYNDDAMDAAEGADSSPPPTDPRMRIGTQGIDLGSEDTEGEDEDEGLGVISSDLLDFVVEGDEEDVLAEAPLLTSSMEVAQPRRASQGGRGRRLARRGEGDVGAGRRVAKDLRWGSEADEEEAEGARDDQRVDEVLEIDDDDDDDGDDGDVVEDSDELPELRSAFGQTRRGLGKRQRRIIDDSSE